MALMGNQNISFGLSFEERKTDKEGRREEREKKKKGREEEEEEEEKEKKKEFKEYQRYGIVWNLTLSMDYLNFLYGYMGCGL